MGNESKTLRDLLAGVISGTTINVLETTTTDLIRAVVDTTGAYLKVSGSGTSGASFTGGTVQDLNVAGTLSVHGSAGTSGWFPYGTSGNGIATAGGIITSITWPALNTVNYEPVNVTGSTTGTTYNYYRCSGATAMDFYLPAAAGDGSWLITKNLNGATVTVTADGTDKIDGNGSYALNNLDSITLISGVAGTWDIN